MNLPHSPSNLTPSQRMSGVSLIELMVSLVIGSLLIVGAVTIYMQSRNTYRTNEAAARLQETARYAMEIIEPDVRMAGYWGMTNRGDFIDNRGNSVTGSPAQPIVITNDCGANWAFDTVRFLDGRDNGNYDLGCAGIDPSADADVLIVRRASSAVVAANNSNLQLQANRLRGLIFRSASIPTGFGVAPASATHNMIVNAYYISNPAAGQFFLRRKALIAGPAITDEVIIPDVADLQVQFGIDDNGDNNADQYVNPEAAALATAQIVSARIWLMVVAPDAEVGFEDDRVYELANQDYGGDALGGNQRRLVVSKTIQLRNSFL